MIHGRSEAHTSPLVGRCSAGGCCGCAAADASCERSAGESHRVCGRQTRRKPIKQAIEISEAPISTIHGLMKLEMRNCGTAKETPVTRIAGQISIMPRNPANAQMSQNGTMSENS